MTPRKIRLSTPTLPGSRLRASSRNVVDPRTTPAAADQRTSGDHSPTRQRPAGGGPPPRAGPRRTKRRRCQLGWSTNANRGMGGRLSARRSAIFRRVDDPERPVSDSSSNACATARHGSVGCPQRRRLRRSVSVGVGEGCRDGADGESGPLPATNAVEAEDDPLVQWLLQGDPAHPLAGASRPVKASETEVATERARGSTRAGVLGCWRCGLRWPVGGRGLLSGLRRRSQRPRRGLWLPVSHRRLSRRPTRNRPRHRPTGRVPSGASRGPRRTQSCSTCATSVPRTVR